MGRLAGEARKLAALVRYQFKRKFGLVERQIIKNYLSQTHIRKLHIGCGNNILEGWLNSDYCPRSATILHLDAAQSFPLGNDEFDYIFSEHMIEHVSYSQGQTMLKECFRILRPNGTIRLSTPDLSFLIDLYKEDKTSLQREYITWAIDKFVSDAPRYEDIFVINNFVRAWGHLFIYDEKTLRSSMEEAGFANIVRCDLNQSEDDSLSNLENEKRLPNGFLKLETMTLEGRKSATATQK
jgi:predicted SAM-dependent methyltransferase